MSAEAAQRRQRILFREKTVKYGKILRNLKRML